MKTDKLNILLIEGNARQVLPMAKSLRRLGHNVITYNSSRFDYGYTSRYPQKKLLRNLDWKKEDLVYNQLVDDVKNFKIDLIIPMNDTAAIFLSRNKINLSKFVDIAVNDWNIFQISMDKFLTMKVCMENNIPSPLTVIDIDGFEKIKNQFKYPIVVKPRTGCGAVGFHIANDYKDLVKYYKYASAKYGPCLIQEYIPQTDLQYKAELFVDSTGDIKSAVVFAKVRWYPIDGGSSTLNKTVERPDIIENCVKLLKAINWRGYADIDLIQDPRDNIAKIIEINPRITGSVKICFKAGVNFAKQIVEDHLGQEITSMSDYKKDIYLRYFQKDILWLIKSHDRFKSNPSWFNFSNNVDQIWDWRDPLPFLFSSLVSFSKLKEDANKRK